MTIFYRLGNKMYANITNRCSCDCVFCIRRNSNSIGDADTLWLEREPTIEEIKQAFDTEALDGVTEIVFCGYGEPMERADIVIEIGEYIKTKTSLPIRLNTNGLVKLINPEFELSKLNLFDTVSISLNSDNSNDYQKLTRTVFGEISFESMLSFAKEMKKYTNVFFTVVDSQKYLSIEKCKFISEKLGISLRVRYYEGELNNS